MCEPKSICGEFTARDQVVTRASTDKMVKNANEWLKKQGFDTWNDLFVTMPQEDASAKVYVDLLKLQEKHGIIKDLDHVMWSHVHDAIRLAKRAETCEGHVKQYKSKRLDMNFEIKLNPEINRVTAYIENDQNARYLQRHFEGQHKKAKKEADYFFDVCFHLMVHLKYI